MWFGYIVRLSQWGEGGYFTGSNDLLYTFHSRRLEEGREGSAPCA
jgi:hypothetical protein